MECLKLLGRFIKVYWRGLIVVIWPLICLPVFLSGDKDDLYSFRCLYVTLVMAVFWVTEALPVPITSMLPIFLFPLFGILDAEATCMSYFKETNVMFVSSIIIALAIEFCGLHKRIALIAILCIGCSPRRLHLGLICMTMFVSYWIVNTAATAMMCPIISAILDEFEQQGMGQMYEIVEEEGKGEVRKPKDFATCFFLSATYAATIGGVGTMIGTGTNLVFRGFFASTFPEAEEVSFTAWILYGIPTTIMMILCTYLYLEIAYMGLFRPNSENGQIVKRGNENKAAIREVIKKKYRDLGPVRWHEVWVGILFVSCVLLWFFRKPQLITGWGDLVEKEYKDREVKIKDAVVGIMIVTAMFVIPSSPTFFHAFDKDPQKRPKLATTGLLTWQVVQTKMPWGLVFLLGGGFALASGITKSGMDRMLGSWLERAVGGLPPFLILAIICFVISCLTEFTANVAICNIFASVVLKMAQAIKQHPLYIGIPFAWSCSFSFMLPVGTPGNAVAAAAGNLRTIDMCKAGTWISLITWLILIGTWELYGYRIFNADDFPEWADLTTLLTSGTTGSIVKKHFEFSTDSISSSTEVVRDAVTDVVNLIVN